METLTQGPKGPKSNFLRSVEEVTHACQTVKGIVSSDLLVTSPSDRIVISYSTSILLSAATLAVLCVA